jgi:hypothetical protein
MKELITAKEAKILADSHSPVDKMIKKILRKVRSCAKKGEYGLKYPSPHGETIDKQICERLRELGYKACTSIVAANIFVNWNHVEEE